MKSNLKKIAFTAGAFAGLFSIHSFAESASAAPAGGFGAYGTLIWMVVLLGVFYFMLIRPQKKREKAERELRNNLQIGDKIITIGGFTGRVINVRDDEVTFETGAAKTRLTVMKWAIQSRESNAASAATADSGDEIRTKPEKLPEENQ